MANKINYQTVLDRELEKISEENKVPLLLLHSCCAPCSSYCLEYLSHYFNINLFYYNPNIYPESEYAYRLNELHRLADEMTFENNISFTEAEYDPDVFFRLSKGYENEPERGKRCRLCLYNRLEASAKKAAEIGADYFTTTLSISPMKDAQYLNSCGRKLSHEYGVPYLYSDFKKKGGYQRSIVLSREYGLYRQNYCGCIYSRRDMKNDDVQTAQENNIKKF